MNFLDPGLFVAGQIMFAVLLILWQLIKRSDL